MGQFAQAIEFFEEALTIAREISYRQGEGNTLAILVLLTEL